MPTIKVEMLEGRSDEQKKKFAKAVTEAAMKELKSELQHIDVVFVDVPKKNWCTGGAFFSD